MLMPKRVKPVSYTHLDVYKRQAIHRTGKPVRKNAATVPAEAAI